MTVLGICAPAVFAFWRRWFRAVGDVVPSTIPGPHLATEGQLSVVTNGWVDARLRLIAKLAATPI
jgi:hypothetical protein